MRIYREWEKLNGVPDDVPIDDKRRFMVFRTFAVVILLVLLAMLSACAYGPSTEVVNYRTYTDSEKGIFYIYDGVLDKGELISGVGGDQTRVYITRQGS